MRRQALPFKTKNTSSNVSRYLYSTNFRLSSSLTAHRSTGTSNSVCPFKSYNTPYSNLWECTVYFTPTLVSDGEAVNRISSPKEIAIVDILVSGAVRLPYNIYLFEHDGVVFPYQLRR